MADDPNNILSYYKNELKWNPPFAEMLGKYCPGGLEGYLCMRESVQTGSLPPATRELIFMILDCIDDEASGAKAHAVAAIEAGLGMEELTEALVLVTLVKGINVFCKTGVVALNAAELRWKELTEPEN